MLMDSGFGGGRCLGVVVMVVKVLMDKSNGVVVVELVIAGNGCEGGDGRVVNGCDVNGREGKMRESDREGEGW